MSEHSFVWVVTRWEFGGGGDDDRSIVGVFSTPEKAYEVAGRHDAEVVGYPLDREQRSRSGPTEGV